MGARRRGEAPRLGPEVAAEVGQHPHDGCGHGVERRPVDVVGEQRRLEVTADQQRTIPIPSIAGVIAIVAGAGMIFFGRFESSR